MASSTKIVANADDQKAGMTIDELFAFVHQVKVQVKMGNIKQDDIFRGSIGFSAQVKRLSVEPKENDRGVMHTA